ncbi:MAG: hypothetical protein R6U78_15775 [Bacteroidales bacterium]
MKQSDIKNSFHQLIDEIDNEPLLMKFYDLLIKSRVQKEGELWNQLSNEQKNELLLAESESHYQKNLIDHKTQRSKHKK